MSKRGDELLNSYKGREIKHWKDVDNFTMSRKIHGVGFDKMPKVTSSGKGRESHRDSLIEKPSAYRFPCPPNPVPVGSQAMHPCFACVRAHEKDATIMCIKGSAGCERCQSRRDMCNQDGQVPKFNDAEHHRLHNYRLARAREENTWPVEIRFRRKDLSKEFFQELHSMREYLVQQEEKEEGMMEDCRTPRSTKVPDDEARAIQLYNFTCQNIARYSFMKSKALDDLKRIKAKYPGSKLLGQAALPDERVDNNGDRLMWKKLKIQPIDQIVVYPNAIGAITGKEKAVHASSSKSNDKRARKTELSDSDDSDGDYEPKNTRQKILPERRIRRVKSSSESARQPKEAGSTMVEEKVGSKSSGVGEDAKDEKQSDSDFSDYSDSRDFSILSDAIIISD